MKNVVKELRTSRESYVIIWNGKFGVYMAINKKDIDENGCLTKTYNGITGCSSKDINDTIKQRIDRDRIADLVDEGMTLEDAMAKVILA